MQPSARHVGQDAYFSDCIVNDCDPERDGEEGILDRKRAGDHRAGAETGEPQIQGNRHGSAASVFTGKGAGVLNTKTSTG